MPCASVASTERARGSFATPRFPVELEGNDDATVPVHELVVARVRVVAPLQAVLAVVPREVDVDAAAGNCRSNVRVVQPGADDAIGLRLPTELGVERPAPAFLVPAGLDGS